MLSEPFKILKEKIPFVEYLIRGGQFIVKPTVETQEKLPVGNMRFALWDIFLSVSLFTTAIGLLSIYEPNVNLSDSLSVFSSQFVLLFEFGYYAYFSTISFFVVILVFMYIFKPSDIHPFKGAFLASLHYARCYAIFLFFFLPLVAIYINALFTELMSIAEFTKLYEIESWIIMAFFAFFYVWCCVIPIKRYWKPLKSNMLSYFLVLLATNLAFSANSLAPNLGALELNKEKACNFFIQSAKVRSLTQDQQTKFNEQCLEK